MVLFGSPIFIPNLIFAVCHASQRCEEHQVGGTWKVQLSVETMPSHRHTGVTESNVHSHWYDRVSRGSIRWKPEGQDAVWDGEYETKYFCQTGFWLLAVVVIFLFITK